VGHGGRPAGMRGWQDQPREMVEYEHWHKNKRKCRWLGCGLQFGGAENDLLLAIRLQSSNTLFSAARTSNSRCLVLYLVQRCDARVTLFRTKLSGTAPSRCIEAPRAPLERASRTPARGPRAPPPRSPRVAESWSWSRGKWQAAGAIFVVGKAVLTLHPPLRPLSHNANPRDGAQDMMTCPRDMEVI
jgi:hypothetical protein